MKLGFKSSNFSLPFGHFNSHYNGQFKTANSIFGFFFLAPNFKLFHIPPTTQAQRLKMQVISFTIGTAPNFGKTP